MKSEKAGESQLRLRLLCGNQGRREEAEVASAVDSSPVIRSRDPFDHLAIAKITSSPTFQGIIVVFRLRVASPELELASGGVQEGCLVGILERQGFMELFLAAYKASLEE